MNKPAVATLIVAAACEGPFVAPPPYGPPPAAPATVTVTPDSATVITDDTLRLSAVVRDSAGNVLTGVAVSWTSTDTTIATLTNALGTVHGQRPGVARIRALAGTTEGAVSLFVTPVVFNGFAAGSHHVCAAANNRHVYCWGRNTEGEIGIGGTSFVEPVPRLVPLATAAGLVAAGGGHSCALATTGVADCWGRSASGQLGRGGTIGNPLRPSPVLTIRAFAALTAGAAHSCGLGRDGRAECWGSNRSGQLGDNTVSDRQEPQSVFDDAPWLILSAGGNHSCGLAIDSLLHCWGANDQGQLGDSSFTGRRVPAVVQGGRRIVAISAGGAHTCALTSAGAAYCWGRNTSGETGTGLPDSAVVVPASVAGALSFRAIAAGAQHTCAIATDSTAHCWGANGFGQLGDSSLSDRPMPVLVHGGLRFQALSAGAGFTCGLTGGLVLYCWGDGTQGQLGRPMLGSSTIPVRVSGQ